MIKEINEHELDDFMTLMAEVEAGNHYNPNNPQHEVWLRKRIAGHFFRGGRAFGCYLDDSTPVAIAIILIEDQLFGPPICELLDIGVDPAYRRLGYGSVLLQHVEEIARQAGVYFMFMWTDAHEYQNLAFYGKNGFVPVATLLEVHGPDDPGHACLRKILQK